MLFRVRLPRLYLGKIPVILYLIIYFVKKCYETEVENMSDEGNYCKR
jgi:hypothetical protein